jgi:hypothetical protein
MAVGQTWKGFDGDPDWVQGSTFDTAWKHGVFLWPRLAWIFHFSMALVLEVQHSPLSLFLLLPAQTLEGHDVQ